MWTFISHQNALPWMTLDFMHYCSQAKFKLRAGPNSAISLDVADMKHQFPSCGGKFLHAPICVAQQITMLRQPTTWRALE